MSVGIEQTLEVLEMIKKTAVVGISALQDGFQIADLLRITEIYEDIIAGVQGITEVDDELKDLDAAEVKELAEKAYEVVVAIIEATKADSE